MKAEVEYRVQKVKSRCKKLSAPEDGGSYDVFKARPLVQQIDYRVVDAAYMPNLFQNLQSETEGYDLVGGERALGS